jgi:hypothetical protein
MARQMPRREAAELCQIASHQARDLLARQVARGDLAMRGVRKGAYYQRPPKNMEDSKSLACSLHKQANSQMARPEAREPRAVNASEQRSQVDGSPLRAQEVCKRGRVLPPSRSVGATVPDDDSEPFEWGVKRPVAGLGDQQTAAGKVDAGSAAQLKELRYGA